MYLRDDKLVDVALPDWMADTVGAVGRMGAAERVAAIHPEDKEIYFDAFHRCLSGGLGVVTEAAYRIVASEGWSPQRARLVNLLDHEVGAIVIATDAREEVVPLAPDPGAETIGEQSSARWMVGYLHRTGTFQRAEGKVEEITGHPAESLVGHSLVEYMHPDSHSDGVHMWMDLISDAGSTRQTRRCFVHPDGTEVWVESNFMNRLTPDGGDILMVAYDISERRAQEQALRTSHEEFRLLAEDMTAAVFRADQDGRITFRNGRFSALTDGAGNIEFLRQLVEEEAQGAFDDELRGASEGTAAAHTFEVRSCAAGLVLSVSCRRVDGGPDGVGGTTSFVGAVSDVSATVALRERADHDGLTGLLNRAALEERLDGALRDGASQVVVLFVDLDGFKAVNDTYGHDVGDDVLESVGTRLRDAFRPADDVARFGGDEFVVVCHDVDSRGEGMLVRRLQAVLGHPIVWDGGSWTPAASIGVARAVPGDGLADVLRRADRAMFVVKRQHHQEVG